MIAFRQKMATPEAQKQYRRRSRVIEFCHAWIKSKLGLRQFHLRGLDKVQLEMLWACPHLQPATMDPTAQTTSRNRLTSSRDREIQKLLAQKTPRLRIRFPNPRSFSARLSKDGFFTASTPRRVGQPSFVMPQAKQECERWASPPFILRLRSTWTRI